MNGSFLARYGYYLLFAFSAIWLFVLPGWPSRLLALAGMLLAAFGWIKSSASHRQRLRLLPKPRGPIPFWWYELRPFCYLCSGLLLGACANNPWWYPSAILLSAAGLQLWSVRHWQR